MFPHHSLVISSIGWTDVRDHDDDDDDYTDDIVGDHEYTMTMDIQIYIFLREQRVCKWTTEYNEYIFESETKLTEKII